MKPTLTLADYQRAARILDCHVAAVMAVAQVESSGNGFYPNGSLKSRFEPTWFTRLAKKTASNYAEAYALDPTNAMMATSWGKFQIMGFNHRIAGYATVQAMVTAFTQSEANQLSGFIGFIQSKKLQDELRMLNWRGFAYTYNGENYEALGYHIKMADAYTKLIANPAIVEAELKKKQQT